MTEKRRLSEIVPTDSATSQKKLITVNGNYQGAIELSVENDIIKGQLIADDMNVAGIDIEMTHTNAEGAEVTNHFLTDRIGRFSGERYSLTDDYSIIAVSQVETPVGGRLDISSKAISTPNINTYFLKTEDILSYLMTENDEHFVAEI